MCEVKVEASARSAHHGHRPYGRSPYGCCPSDRCPGKAAMGSVEPGPLGVQSDVKDIVAVDPRAQSHQVLDANSAVILGIDQ
jgi:hypothetical protein